MITIVFKVQLLRLAPTTLIIVLLNLSVFSLFWPSSLPRCRTLYLTLFKPHFCKTYKQGHILLIEAFGFSLSSITSSLASHFLVYWVVPGCPYLLIILGQHLLLDTVRLWLIWTCCLLTHHCFLLAGTRLLLTGPCLVGHSYTCIIGCYLTLMGWSSPLIGWTRLLIVCLCPSSWSLPPLTPGPAVQLTRGDRAIL